MDFTHFNEQGRARMVDVSGKAPTLRAATAAGTVKMQPSTVAAIRSGGVPKGDVLAVAQVAGVMAAKRASDLIPMCHPLALTAVDVRFALREDAVDVEATVKCRGETGVEMEALTAVSAAALTVYDMCKALEKGMEITDVRLLEKTGGKSGDWRRA
ncbi:MAG: cyclic pyranopterin monophosphate synthase MoaC [Oscillospiraceae bacterium]|nr:cyclic pyranopterin monophosphate synthase MoaC [Oscillospiraceae bacterium]